MDYRLFAKFGDKKHLEKLQKEGHFFCNTITYFSNLEDNNVRGDKFESTFKFKYAENLILQLKDADNPKAEWKRLKVTNMLYQEYYKQSLGNLFCMSAFQLSPQENVSVFSFDKRFYNYEHALIIHNQVVFFDRLKKAASTLQFRVCGNLVEYFDLQKYSGERTLFQKDLKYSWQEEFRIIIYTNKYLENDPFEFSIGSIEDMSEIIDLTKTQKLEYKL
jgi:hypothetical protein